MRANIRNISIVTVSGLEFVGCSQNHVKSVGQFQLEDSSFFGNGQAIVNSTILTIEDSTANLDGVAFVSIKFIGNNGTTVHLLNGMITSIDHSKFINISGSNLMVLLAENKDD